MSLQLSAVQVAHVWRATLIAALLNAFGSPADAVMGSRIPGMPLWPSIASGAVGLAIAGFIVFTEPWRRRETKLASGLFVLNNAAIVTALWATSGVYATFDGSWVPFQANKLGALAVALLGPPLWALASIAAFVGTAVLKLHLLDPAVRARIGFGEPWVVLVYGGFGVALLFYRLRGLTYEREVVRAQVEAAAARKSAGLLLAVRDLSNTPLQVVAICSAIMRARSPDQCDTLDRVDRAIDELRGLGRALRRYESALEWRPGDEAIDSTALLRSTDEQSKVEG